MEISGVKVKDLVKEYGSPLFVYNQNKIENQLQIFKKNFVSDQFSCDVIYASKAFNCKAMIQLVQQNGCSLDCVSGGELYTAFKAGFDMKRVYFHGNNKSKEEIQMALKYHVGTIVVDNVMEVELLRELSKDIAYDVSILLRINPGVEAHTHKYIVTADIDSKFGVSIENKDEIFKIVDTVFSSSHLYFNGFHAHIGSQIFDSNAFVAEINTICTFVKQLNIPISTLNLGGGFAAYYTSEDHPIPIEEVCKVIVKAVEKNDISISKLWIEPGRSIVAEAGSTIYTVGFMKQTLHKNYVFVNGGMSDNIRPALYQAKYDCVIDGKEENEKVCHYKIAGKCCESGDVLIEDAYLPKVKSNDLLIVKTTGAYGYSMASHYNKALGLPVIFCKEGKSQQVIRGETYEDLIRLETDLCV